MTIVHIWLILEAATNASDTQLLVEWAGSGIISYVQKTLVWKSVPDILQTVSVNHMLEGAFKEPKVML